MKCPECGKWGKTSVVRHEKYNDVLVRCPDCGVFGASFVGRCHISELGKLFDARWNVAYTYNPYWDKSLTIGELPAWRAAAMVKEEEGNALIAVAIFVALAVVLVALALRLGLPIDPTWVFKAIGG